MLLYGILIVIIVLLAVLFMMMTRVYKTHPRPHNEDPGSLGIEFEEIGFQTQNEKQLYGWWIPVEGGNERPVIILIHGWTRNVQRMLPYVKMLHNDFNLLAFDSRSHGRSEEDTYSSMPRFAEDISAAISFIDANYPGKAIGALGLSMGGAAAIYAASKNEHIKAVASVGAFAHPADVMRLEFKKRHIPYFPMVWLMFEYMQFIMKDRFNDIAPEKNIGKANAQFLIIHGTEDITAPVAQAHRLFKAANDKKAELLLLPGMAHSNCHEFPGIDKQILEFFKKSLK